MRKYQDPFKANNFLDSCAFDPKYSPEDQAAHEINELGDRGVVTLLIAHSVQKEIEHPNTPESVRRKGRAMIFTLETELNTDEVRRKAEIHQILTGNGRPEKFAADATHVFEASKYAGYFITADRRILEKRSELREICAAMIVTPTEWLAIYRAHI